MTAPGRECGDCTLCCKVMAIEALVKSVGSWCPHCKPGRGCLIYANRPTECQSFSCLWLVDDKLDAHWKPNKSKLVLRHRKMGLRSGATRVFPMPGAKSRFELKYADGRCLVKPST
jgi:hypothetical protein